MTVSSQQDNQGQPEEVSLLGRLLKQVNLDAPTKGIESLDSVDDADKSSRLGTAINHFVTELRDSHKTVDKLNSQLMDELITGIDRKLSKQVSAIMQQEQFKAMESAWRGLAFLVKRTNFYQKIQIQVLNASKQDMMDDLSNAMDLTQTGLYHHIYRTEYDQAGGEPIAAVVTDYYFGNRSDDLAMLTSLAKIGSSSHTPVIASANAGMFGLNTATDLPYQIKNMDTHFNGADYIKWRGLRESEDSRYLGLCFPRFLLREPYTPENSRFNFEFHEVEGQPQHDQYLWGNASMAFASRLTESFAEHGWCVNIRGPLAGGRVDDLPVHTYEEAGEVVAKVPTEVMISDKVELELANNGFIPLTYYKNRDYACFFSAQSVQKPIKYTTDDATANAKLSANLPYLFLVSRLSHYLRVQQRENIGSNREVREIQKELNDWLKNLVTDMPNPGPELMSKRPLKEGRVVVEDIPDSPGFYKVALHVRPHIQLEGMDIGISLVSKMPKVE